MQQNSSLAYEITLITNNLAKWLPQRFTIIERRLVSSHSNLQACLDITIFPSKTLK
jgi:hypothetical protein